MAPIRRPSQRSLSVHHCLGCLAFQHSTRVHKMRALHLQSLTNPSPWCSLFLLYVSTKWEKATLPGEVRWGDKPRYNLAERMRLYLKLSLAYGSLGEGRQSLDLDFTPGKAFSPRPLLRLVRLTSSLEENRSRA